MRESRLALVEKRLAEEEQAAVRLLGSGEIGIFDLAGDHFYLGNFQQPEIGIVELAVFERYVPELLGLGPIDTYRFTVFKRYTVKTGIHRNNSAQDTIVKFTIQETANFEPGIDKTAVSKDTFFIRYRLNGFIRKGQARKILLEISIFRKTHDENYSTGGVYCKQCTVYRRKICASLFHLC